MPTREELLFAPRLKLERAAHHINDLEAQVAAFLAERPFKLVERINRKAGKVSYRVKKEKPIPPAFPAIIGDAVHNLRAALDLTMFGIAGHIDPKINFPFAKEADRLAAAIKDGRVKVAGKKVVEAVAALEPYLTGNTGLALVHALDIQDKHRLLILSGQRAIFTGVEGDALAKAVETQATRYGRLIILDGPEDEDLITVERTFVLRDLPTTENETQTQPAFAITFGEGELLKGMPVVETLARMADDTRTAVESVIDAFLDPDNV